MKRAFALAVLAYCCGGQWGVAQADEQWRVTERIDSMTDRKITTASVQNAKGYRLSLYLREDGAAVANFSLPSASTDALDPERLILLRVDKYPPEDVGEMLRAQRTLKVSGLVEGEPAWVNFVVGRNADNPARIVRRLQKGQRVVVRYYLFTGGAKETEFSLTGARNAVAEAIGVSSEFDPVAEQRIEDEEAAKREVTKARSAARDRCFALQKPLRCTDRLAACVGAAPTPENAATQVACLDIVEPIPGEK